MKLSLSLSLLCGYVYFNISFKFCGEGANRKNRKKKNHGYFVVVDTIDTGICPTHGFSMSYKILGNHYHK